MPAGAFAVSTSPDADTGTTKSASGSTDSKGDHCRDGRDPDRAHEGRSCSNDGRHEHDKPVHDERHHGDRDKDGHGKDDAHSDGTWRPTGGHREHRDPACEGGHHKDGSRDHRDREHRDRGNWDREHWELGLSVHAAAHHDAPGKHRKPAEHCQPRAGEHDDHNGYKGNKERKENKENDSAGAAGQQEQGTAAAGATGPELAHTGSWAGAGATAGVSLLLGGGMLMAAGRRHRGQHGHRLMSA